jgi:class 3 adenylate cyclase/ribosomal protein L40E
MQCSQCRHDNPPGAKFCLECGARLTLACTQCGVQLPPGAKFCLECGAALGASGVGATHASPSASRNGPDGDGRARHASPLQNETAPTPEGERRQLTVLFCDLVGSTEIAAQLDPEDWHHISKEYQQVAAAAVTRFGGHVDKFLGDGLVCFFGVPEAHDDDAERAVRAGLAIVEGVKGLGVTGLGKESDPLTPNPLTPNPLLQVRVGMHTGSAVVAHGGGASQDVFGDTPNIAARVQGAAEPDTVVITAAT